MVTRSQRGIIKPLERLSIHTSSASPIPKSHFLALKDPNWCNVMYDEYDALVKNGTWILVPRPTNDNLVRSMWLFKHKFHVDGTLSHYKARLVANGSSQQLGVDFDETFSPVVKPATIHTVFSLVVSRQWPIHQFDVKNAFLNGDLSVTVYMHQPLDFVDSRYPNYGFRVSCLLIYVDDIILTAFSLVLLQQIIDSLHKEFDMTDLRELNYFLGISAVRHPTGLFLSQKKYALQLHERAHMVNWGLQYLTFTRPDLSYAVQQVCLYMHDTREPHFAALKRISRYVQSTLELVITFCRGLLNDNTPSRAIVLKRNTGVSDVLLMFSKTASNPIQHQRTKHIKIDIHFVRDMVKAGHVRVLHVPSRFQYADIFTKGLPSALFEDFRSSLSVRPPPASTAGAY
ncbi:ribonuclease H-like domain-containing protein [Tanacetum coccineum]